MFAVVFPYLLIFVTLFTIMVLYLKVTKYYNIMDCPNHRSSHKVATLTGGGVIFYLGMLIYSLCFGFHYPFLLIGLTLIAGISFIDDIRYVPKMLRFVFHLVAVLFLFMQLKMYDVSWYTFIFFSLVYVGFINIYNFMDGINGLTGGYSLVAIGSFLYINNYICEFIDNNVLYVLLLSVLVFNFFNFRKKATCFCGDVGSIGMAFMLLFLGVKLILKTADFSYFILFAVYGIDGGLTIIRRLLLRENIFQAHRKHAYQILANELGVPHLKVTAFYCLLQAGIFVGYVLLRGYGYWYLAGTIVFLSLLYVLFIRMHVKIIK